MSSKAVSNGTHRIPGIDPLHHGDPVGKRSAEESLSADASLTPDCKSSVMAFAVYLDGRHHRQGECVIVSSIGYVSLIKVQILVRR